MPQYRLFHEGASVEAPNTAVGLKEQVHAHEGSFGWIDLDTTETKLLGKLAEELELHALAVEDALTEHERPKLGRFSTHLLLTISSSNVDAKGHVSLERMTAFIFRDLVVTVHEQGFPMNDLCDRIEQNLELTRAGVGSVIWAALDVVVDNQITCLETLDDIVEDLVSELFERETDTMVIQRQAFALRRSVMRMQHITLPLREVVTTLTRRSADFPSVLDPYFSDVYDHTIHAAEWSEGLRDQLSSLIETNLALQGNRMNLIMKKVTSWAAIIAVPTFITGYFGQNVEFPGTGSVWAWWVSLGIMAVSGAGLYWWFKRNDWL